MLLHLPPAESASIANPSAFAKFSPCDDPINVTEPRPEAAAIRSKSLPTAEWIPVDVNVNLAEESEYGGMRLKVNPALLGWHYGWRSNKNTRFTRHCLRVFLFDGDRVVKVMESSGFLVYSGKGFVVPAPTDEKLEVPQGDVRLNAKRKSQRRRGLRSVNGEEDEAFVLDVAVFSKQKVDAELNLDGDLDLDLDLDLGLDLEVEVPSIRTLLERALKVGEEKGVEGKRGVVDGDQGELDELGLDFDEDTAVGLIESLLNDDTMCDLASLATGTEGQIAGLDPDGHGLELGLGLKTNNTSVDEIDGVVEAGGAEFELNRGLQLKRIKQIKETLLSESLTEELCAFLSDCSQGSLGQSLCDTLEREENALANPFVVDLARTLFRRFQRVITRRVEQDLFANGLIPECLLNGARGTQQSTVDAFHRMDETDALVYDEKDVPLLQRFLNLLCSYGRLPNLDKCIAETPEDSPFAIINKVWVETSNTLRAFFGEKLVELGFLKPTSGKLMMRLMSTRQIYCEASRFCVKGPPMLSFHGYIEMQADGEGHRLYEVSPLFNYVEVAGRSYVHTHEILSDGSYQ